MDKVWEIRDPEAYTRGKRTVVQKGPPPRDEKDPAAAYSRSMFYWGGGQLYNDETGKGTMFLVAMVLCIAGAVLAVIFRSEILQSLRSREIPLATAFLAGELLLFFVILFWIYNAGDAYQKAARSRRTRFPGVRSRFAPFLASLCVPGWGQFLNGQPLKGSTLSALSVLGIFSVLAAALTFLAWPLLEASDHRFVVEGIAAVALIIVPCTPLLWTFGAYDALAVSMDDLKKESFWERVKAAYYRGRTQGWVRGVFPQVKRTFLLLLFLTFFVIVVYYWFPAEFYGEALKRTGSDLRRSGFTILPEMIDRISELAAAGK